MYIGNSRLKIYFGVLGLQMFLGKIMQLVCKKNENKLIYINMKIVATVENTVFRNYENGYSVINLSYNKKNLTAVGTIPEVFEGQTLELEGDFIVNKKF